PLRGRSTGCAARPWANLLDPFRVNRGMPNAPGRERGKDSMRLARYLGLTAVAVALIVGMVVALRPAAREARADEAAIDAILREALAAWNVPGAALAVVRDDRVIYL